MKIIALYPLLREEINFNFLKISILSLYKIVDEIIMLIDYPNKHIKFDKKIFKKKKIKIYYLKNLIRKTYAPRDFLLTIGRKNKGTHFVWLDCDEAFTYPFVKNGRKIISDMRPGDKIQMQWLSMWKSVDYFRVDKKSVWSNSFKDFIVCDKNNYSFDNTFLHEARTQGPNTEENTIILKPTQGAVMHFQFVNWNNFQFKQAWYMCLEKIRMKDNSYKINRKYFYTYFENFPKLKRIRSNWLKHIPRNYFYDLNIDTSFYWRDRFCKLFKKYSILRFEQLNIWRNNILNDIFFIIKGRFPVLHTASKVNIFFFFIIEYFRLIKKFINNILVLKKNN
jgi:hypothetical protein